jgi:hypothetical protein
MKPLRNLACQGGTCLALARRMHSRSWRRVVSACCVAAAISGCSRATAPELHATGPEPDAGGSAGSTPHEAPDRSSSGGTAGSEQAVATCPSSYPKTGSVCHLPSSITCTYRGDGPCSKSNPDQIAACNGTWVGLVPGIRCPTDDEGADSGAPDCDGPRPIGDYCGRPGQDCSQSLTARIQAYCDPNAHYHRVELQPNACSGTTLVTLAGLSEMRFDYDDTGKLRSIQAGDDLRFGDCNQFHYVYGTACELTGMRRPACEAAPNDDAGI